VGGHVERHRAGGPRVVAGVGARAPTSSCVCQTMVRRRGKVVGYAARDHGARGPDGPPTPRGYSPQNPVESVQLWGATFKGVPSDAAVTCRREAAQAP
jgi:hypothetical protein